MNSLSLPFYDTLGNIVGTHGRRSNSQACSSSPDSIRSRVRSPFGPFCQSQGVPCSPSVHNSCSRRHHRRRRPYALELQVTRMIGGK
jgi:hypothetical protein